MNWTAFMLGAVSATVLVLILVLFVIQRDYEDDHK